MSKLQICNVYAMKVVYFFVILDYFVSDSGTN